MVTGDPVRYAEAQVQPLRQIHAASPTLAQAIKRINSLCPDAGAAA